MNVATLFERTFGSVPEVTASAPGRVSLLGEHTDYNEGYVLPATLSLETAVALGRSGDEAFHLFSSNWGEGKVEYDAAELPSGYARYVDGCVQVLRENGLAVPPFNMAISSAVPIGVGLSSSAALEIAVLRALRSALGLPLDDAAIAQLAQAAEIRYAGVHCGIMDQMASSVGRPGRLLFLDTRTLESRTMPLPEGGELAVFDCGVPRRLEATPYNERRRECVLAAELLGVRSLRDVQDHHAIEELPSPFRQRARHVVRENDRVLEAARGIEAGRFGELLNESHRSLRDDFSVSIPALDALIDCLVRQADVYGGKLSGAGFGGACVALLKAGTGESVKRTTLRRFSKLGFSGSALL